MTIKFFSAASVRAPSQNSQSQWPVPERELMDAEPMPRRDAAIRLTATRADMNIYGDISSGWLMAQMDFAASSLATLHAGGRVATLRVDGMTFHSPVLIGDEVSVFAELQEWGKSSLRVAVEAWRRDRHTRDEDLVAKAAFGFVAVGQDRRPRPVRHWNYVHGDVDCRQ